MSYFTQFFIIKVLFKQPYDVMQGVNHRNIWFQHKYALYLQHIQNKDVASALTDNLFLMHFILKQYTSKHFFSDKIKTGVKS